MIKIQNISQIKKAENGTSEPLRGRERGGGEGKAAVFGTAPLTSEPFKLQYLVPLRFELPLSL